MSQSESVCWHGLCSGVGIVNYWRTLLTLVAIVGATAAPAFAEVVHPVCVTNQHECGKTAKIAPCCCGHQADTSNQGGPAQSRTQIDSAAASVACAFGPSPASGYFSTMFRAHAAPRAGPVDLPTLFACLLI